MQVETRTANRTAILAVLLTGQFMANIDTAVANVAGPSIRADLHASAGAVGLVVSGYVVAFAVLLITGARLGSSLGYRTTFLLGLQVFTAASLACGLAPEVVSLTVARFVQGAGAALMVPQVLSGIQLHFHGQDRLKALGYFSVALSGGAVAGQFLGGVLIGADLFGSGWRPIFLVNVPIGVALMLAARRILPADQTTGRDPVDLLGVLTLSATVLLVIVPLLLGSERGWPAWSCSSTANAVQPHAAVAHSSLVRCSATRLSEPVCSLTAARRAPTSLCSSSSRSTSRTVSTRALRTPASPWSSGLPPSAWPGPYFRDSVGRCG